MDDTFGRLPSDTLKYICLLCVVPQITLECNKIIKIHLPLIGITYKFWMNLTEVDTESRNLEIDTMIRMIDDFNGEYQYHRIDFQDYSINVNKSDIWFSTEYSDMCIDIKYFKMVQSVLNEYKEYLKTQIVSIAK